MGLCILYLGYGSKKLFKIMMILARLNSAFFVTMSNFFPNTLYEIYLDVLVIGSLKVNEYDQKIPLSHTADQPMAP